MNPTLLLALVLIVGVEISFTAVIWANVIIILISILTMLWQRAPVLAYVRLALVPLIPAVGIWFSIRYFSTTQSVHFAWVMSSRIYAYAFLGGLFNFSTSTSATLASLEQNAHIPTTFVYGMLGAFNFVPKIRSEVSIIRSSAQMRGITLHFWSPQLLFKAIVAALNWSENLAEAMTSHGFSENAPRTHLTIMSTPWWNYLVGGIALIGLQLLLFSGLA
ncbi:energy-coupling factor transporter transmembrane component T family protein [Furfurilactobacillus curtus]|uniref:ABC transporter permease n=1 Tax=Furfurilactobacillus curtus TaxID=1746200 RepID=A0ABQ5JSF4_9LACO